LNSFSGSLMPLSYGCLFRTIRGTVLALLWVMAAATPQATHAEALVSVGDTLPPWFYHEQSAPKGIVHDIFDELVSRMGHQISINIVPFRRIYAELLSGRAHLSVMLVSEEESHYPPELLLGKEPLFSYRVVAVALKSRQLTIETLEQLKRLRLGHIRLLPDITDKISSGSESTAYGNDSMMLKSLVSGRIDVAVTSEPTWFEMSKRLGIEDDLQAVYTLSIDRFYLVWSRPALGENAESLVQKADQVLQAMKREGRLADIISRYSELGFFGEFGEVSP